MTEAVWDKVIATYSKHTINARLPTDIVRYPY